MEKDDVGEKLTQISSLAVFQKTRYNFTTKTVAMNKIPIKDFRQN